MTINAVNNMNPSDAVGKNLPEIREKAAELVNQVFFGTLLRQFRDAQNPELTGLGPGGAIFQRQMDMELIGRMSRKGDSPLVDAIVRQITGEKQLNSVWPPSQLEAYNISIQEQDRIDING